MFPTSVSLKWQGAVDDPNGIGLALYLIRRKSGGSCGQSLIPCLTDPTAAPSTTYTYRIRGMDPQRNFARQFSYDSAGAGSFFCRQRCPTARASAVELCLSDPYNNGRRYLRAVSARYLAADSAGATEWSCGISRDNASANTLHSRSPADADGCQRGRSEHTGRATRPPRTARRGRAGMVSQFARRMRSAGAARYCRATPVFGHKDPEESAYMGNPYVSSKTTDAVSGDFQISKQV